MVVLPDATREVAANTIERLRGKIETLEFTVVNNRKVRVTSSFGIATYPEDGTSIDDLLVKADERLYKAKSQGKNKVA